MRKTENANADSIPQPVVIWMHGLGADSSDMENLTRQLSLADICIRHVFLDAPLRKITINNGQIMPGWYDIVGMRLEDREDKSGITASSLLIKDVIEAQINNGSSPNTIFLAGFSQGGAMALYTAINSSTPLGGVIALSAYLPLANESQALLPKKTPLFLASGKFDPIVLPQFTKHSLDWLTKSGYDNLTSCYYPMEHNICSAEIADLSAWLITQINFIGLKTSTSEVL